jgi:hypothetical protein
LCGFQQGKPHEVRSPIQASQEIRGTKGNMRSIATLTAKAAAHGWKLLFDGKDLDGWANFLE